MPDHSTRGIEVSEDEERYLRRAFRRFAVPYLVAFAAIAWIAIALSDEGARSAADSKQVLGELGERLASVEQSLAALEGRVEVVGSSSAKAGQRIAALEKRPVAKASGDLGGLRRELQRAREQVERLEARLEEQAVGERLAALSSRMGRIEADLKRSTTASSAPVPPAPPARSAPAEPAPQP